MEIGKAYLVHCGDWHTFVGRCVGMISPVVYLMEQVSKITQTNDGDNWHLLAAGDKAARKKASYLHYSREVKKNGVTMREPIRMTVPLTVAAFLWEGKTPMEEEYQ